MTAGFAPFYIPIERLRKTFLAQTGIIPQSDQLWAVFIWDVEFE